MSTHGVQGVLRFDDGRRGFAFGTRDTRLESITRGFGSLFDSARPERAAQRPPLGPALARLLVCVVSGIVLASATAVALGALGLRIWAGAFG